MSKPFRVYEQCLRSGKFRTAYRIMNKYYEQFPLYESAPGIGDLYREVAELTVAKNNINDRRKV